MQNGTAFKLTSLRVSNGALQGEKLPEHLQLLQWGRNESAKGPILFDEKSVAVLNANQARLGFGRVALDFEHNTVPGSPEFARTQEPRPVAGYGTIEAVPERGLFLSAMTWTPRGTEHARDYEDLSPAVAQDEEGRVVFLHSAALTRNGAVYDLSFFSAPSGLEIETATKPHTPMPDTTGADFQALQTTLTKLSADLTARLDALEKRIPADPSEQIKTLSASVEALQKQIKDTSDAATTLERDRVIRLFAAEGKVPRDADGKELSDEQLGKMDVPTLKLLCANTPSTVPLHARKAKEKPGTELKGLARVAAAINAQIKTA